MFKKLRNKLLIINTLIIAALVLSSFSVIYIMTAQNVNHVEVYISFLRKKLAFVHSKVSINTVRGVGYTLSE